jgi:hypothetical protein
MVKTALAAVSLLFIWGAALIPYAVAQEFPYLAPEAPEFDTQSSHAVPERVQRPEMRRPGPVQSAPRPRPRRNDRPSILHRVPSNNSSAGPIGRSAPKAPTFGRRHRNGPHRNAPRPQPGPYYAPPQRPSSAHPPRQYPGRQPAPPVTANRGGMPGAVPGAVQQRPDCSHYPMMIAQARSEGEMRSVARQFLTCLLRSGWSMDQAKTHVISVIETSYRYIR